MEEKVEVEEFEIDELSDEELQAVYGGTSLSVGGLIGKIQGF